MMQTRNPFHLVASMFLMSALGGCTGLPEYTCPDPTGLSCMSQSEIHAAVEDGSIENLQQPVDEDEEVMLPADEAASGATTRTIEAGDPLFVAPEPMRIWFADWRDANDDLHSESYIYIRVGRGTWRIGERVAP